MNHTITIVASVNCSVTTKNAATPQEMTMQRLLNAPSNIGRNRYLPLIKEVSGCGYVTHFGHQFPGIRKPGDGADGYTYGQAYELGEVIKIRLSQFTL